MLQKFMVALLMAGLTAVATAGTVYKWSDGRGQIHYTDLPPDQSDAKILSISHREDVLEDEGAGNESDNGDGGGNADEPTPPPASNDSDEPKIDTAAMAAVQRDVASAKAKQCKEAQDRYQLYVESRRLFRQKADGEREYLTDQQLEEARVRAKQSVAEYCD